MRFRTLPDLDNTSVGSPCDRLTFYIIRVLAGFSGKDSIVHSIGGKIMHMKITLQISPQRAETGNDRSIMNAMTTYLLKTGQAYTLHSYQVTLTGTYKEILQVANTCKRIAILAGAPAVATFTSSALDPPANSAVYGD